MKNILQLIILSFSFISCHKTITPKKLEGEWIVTNGTGVIIDGNYLYNYNFDGSVQSISSNTVLNQTIITFEFNSKNSTYKIISSGYYGGPGLYRYLYTYDGSNYSITDQISSRRDSTLFDEIHEGSYTIMGKSKNIEKNTRLNLAETSFSRNEIHNYTYALYSLIDKKYHLVTDINNYYYQSQGNKYQNVPNSEIINSNNFGTATTQFNGTPNDNFLMSNSASVITVEKLTKNEMKIKLINNYYKKVNSSAYGAYSDNIKLDVTYTLKKK